jgi:flagellar basal body rod protein FlgG
VSKGIYSAASAMQANGRRIEVIADNIANLSSAGFKRRTTSVGSFETALDGKSQPMLRTQSRFDFEQGTLVRNAEPYSLALFGEGFFAVEGKDGELYTRKGNFHVSEDGAIKTDEDLPVAWESHSGAIDPHGPAVTIGSDGTVQQSGEILGRLRIVDFADRQKLVMGENGYFRAPNGLRAGPAQAEVRQGEIESSNASAMTEMIELVEAQRAYEMAANVLSQNDQSYKRLTRQV